MVIIFFNIILNFVIINAHIHNISKRNTYFCNFYFKLKMLLDLILFFGSYSKALCVILLFCIIDVKIVCHGLLDKDPNADS